MWEISNLKVRGKRGGGIILESDPLGDNASEKLGVVVVLAGLVSVSVVLFGVVTVVVF